MIPKIIHQIWCGNSLPSFFKEWGESWIKYNPNWRYEFWDEEKINSFICEYFPEYMDVFKNFPYDIQRWDAIRYLFLWKMGGMYVDFDYECLEPFEDILCGKECCFCKEPPSHIHSELKYRLYNFSNAMIACTPNHPFMQQVIREVFSQKESYYPVNDKFFYVLSTTGPLMLMDTYDKYDRKEDIYLIPAELVSPFGMCEIGMIMSGVKNKYYKEKLQKAKAIHYFLGTWKKNQSINKI